MISASMVKELRERTGCGMMDCKKALTETNGDMEKAIDYLREKGLSKAAKKSGRIAAEGMIKLAFSEDGQKGALIEVNAETDFVAKNKEFVDMVDGFVNIVIENDVADVAALEACPMEDGTVKDVLTAKIAKIGENMTIRRFVKFDEAGTVCVGYSHNGKIGVLLQLETEAALADVQAMGRSVAMQVCSMNPQFVDETQVDPAYLAKEKEILIQQALNEGKPQNIVEKMVEGRLKKQLKETCLMEQTFVMDGDITVKQYVANVAKEIGKEIKVKAFVRYEVGEGIEKKVDDLAAEVAKMTQA